MYPHGKIGNEHRKIADLTVGEYISLQLSILTQALAKAIQEALEKVVPKKDPDEDVYWTTKQAAASLGLTTQTIQARKKKRTIEYEGEGRTTRFTKAACKRHMREHGLPLAALESE